MVEIGPGEGALTAPLLERAGTLEVIEIDRDLAARSRSASRRPQLTLHGADALEFDFARCSGAACASSAICRTTSRRRCCFISRATPTRVRDMHFMLQLEVVERMVAAHSTRRVRPAVGGAAGALRMEKLFNVSEGRLPAAAEGASRRWCAWCRSTQPLHVDEDLLRKAFSARRKHLRNALPGVDFARAGIDPQLRRREPRAAGLRAHRSSG